MRVIGGSARGRKLKRVPGDTTRPIMDRVKENLFNILGNWVESTRWLDLFAGTGQVGIEALSRGAGHSVFVDLERAAIRVIRQNLETTGLAEDAEVLREDAFAYLSRTVPTRFDVIYVAPPQYQHIWIETLQALDDRGAEWLAPGGMVIVQIDPSEFEERSWRSLRLFDRRRYGRTLLCFFELAAGANMHDPDQNDS